MAETADVLPRLIAPALRRALSAMPVVVLTGARQTGKSTLARMPPIAEGRDYFSLDDLSVLDQATHDPDALVRRAARITLDEVQRRPELLLAVKRVVDEGRTPGRFLLTGSANLLLMRDVGETLAGRAYYLPLWPLTRREQLGLGAAGAWDALLETPPTEWRDVLSSSKVHAEAWRALARRGGYPPVAHLMDDQADRSLWFEGYTATYLERDVPRLSAIEHAVGFRRLMTAVALRTGALLNAADLARDVALPPSTVTRYLDLLETSFQVVRVPAYAVNRTKRLIKAPKLYWSDTGLGLHLAGESEPRGVHLENLVLADLLAWAGARVERTELLHYRTAGGAEVDFVMETGARALPIEVKSTSSLRDSDVRHLRTFLAEYPDRAAAGLVLYDGMETYWIRDGILAVPWWRVV